MSDTNARPVTMTPDELGQIVYGELLARTTDDAFPIDYDGCLWEHLESDEQQVYGAIGVALQRHVLAKPAVSSAALAEASEKGSIHMLNNLLAQSPDAPRCACLVVESYPEAAYGLWLAMMRASVGTVSMLLPSGPIALALVPLETLRIFRDKLVEAGEPVAAVFDQVPVAIETPDAYLVITVTGGGTYARVMIIGAAPDASTSASTAPAAAS